MWSRDMVLFPLDLKQFYWNCNHYFGGHSNVQLRQKEIMESGFCSTLFFYSQVLAPVTGWQVHQNSSILIGITICRRNPYFIAVEYSEDSRCFSSFSTWCNPVKHKLWQCKSDRCISTASNRHLALFTLEGQYF